MRRLVSVLLTAVFATAVASAAALFAVSEAQSAAYSQVVDNTTKGRFSASSAWITSDYHWKTDYGSNYRVLRKPSSTAGAARWKVRIPARAKYNVYALWPADRGYTGRATFKVKTTDGWKYRAVSQRINGGKWVKLGSYIMNAGDNWSVMLSSSSSSKGYIIADAIKVTRGTASSTDVNSDNSSPTGATVVREAETWLGVPYEWGGMDRNGVDCSGLTYRVYGKFGITLPRTSQAQYSSGPGRIISKSEARPGDMVFFGSGSGDVVSVGIVSGSDQVIKATVPGDVVRRESISAVARNVGGWTGYRRVI